MKRHSSLLLLPLGLALGYGVAQWRDSRPSAPEESPSAAPAFHSSSSPAELRALWRNRFLQMLEEPSLSLQSASYYALAKQLAVEDMPYFLEAMYPEGWTRFRGDLPLALYMEWASLDSSGLALFTEQLNHTYPDLLDNLSGVFFNLGLQNRPGAARTVELIGDPDLRSLLADQFIDGISQQHPELLFPYRLQLLGPQAAFSKLSEKELPQAAQNYWTYSKRYLEEGIQPDIPLAIEIGRRYLDAATHLILNEPQQAATIVGAIAQSGTASPETIARLDSALFVWHLIERSLSDEEKRKLLDFLSQHPSFWRQNANGFSAEIMGAAINREIAERLLKIPDLSPRTRNLVLSTANQFYDDSEFIRLISAYDQGTAQIALVSKLATGSSTDALSTLSQVPVELRSAEVLNAALEKSLSAKDATTFAALCDLYPEAQDFLPNDTRSAATLWQFDPERYLHSIETLQGSEKQRQLQMIAFSAEDEELGMILESGTFEQQTDVLINLIRQKPYLSTEILKHESPQNINARQAAQIGETLAYTADHQTALSYFQAGDLSSPSSQIALLTFCLNNSEPEQELSTSQELAQLSTQHDYLYRTANAFQEETDNTDQLLLLRQEAPEVFVNVLTSAIDQFHWSNLRSRAQRLLISPQLSQEEKLKIHDALYRGTTL
ncbi:hypothetical protein QEH56_11175 [Pelagicoccus enzymogenes]|uniref:hypothetical protein n=1 Tax=Pelagicoccus enzymogenes TaxID=2773457 RepID=UPI00280CD55B|nr:hypothetical protein [Pelagicoccus enzymogenes]MDQ8198716.1 hypothetical protein [Pelagicoccus enzymogenes]